MKAMNLYFLAQVAPQDDFSSYEMSLSGRKELKVIKEHEQQCIHQLVEKLSSYDLPLEAFDGFYFSYVISHISKEFDLLKIAADYSHVLNIELKSQSVDPDRIRHQLLQNRYYLRHISQNIDSFTYVAQEDALYRLNEEDALQAVPFDGLVKILAAFGEACNIDIETLFTAADFLISPAHTPERFLSHSYFLTTQQNDFKAKIMGQLSSAAPPSYLCVIGSPGTGKTLLLYDLAVTMSSSMEVCILHCGSITESHRHLDEMMDHVDIISAEMIRSPEQLSHYQLILVDEAHRLGRDLFEVICQAAGSFHTACVFACDHRQLAYASEENRQVGEKISDISAEVYKLSDKIRANKELSSFTLSLFDLTRKTGLYGYECISVIYASSAAEAARFIVYHMQRGYIFMNYGPGDEMPDMCGISGQSGDVSVIAASGQEFDRIVMVMDRHFYYDKAGKLCCHEDSGSRHLHLELLFQGIARAREGLCLIITDNLRLFEHVNSIKTRIPVK